jgi:hypothetical protein
MLAALKAPDELLTEIVDCQILMRRIQPTRLPTTPQRDWR